MTSESGSPPRLDALLCAKTFWRFLSSTRHLGRGRGRRDSSQTDLNRMFEFSTLSGRSGWADCWGMADPHRGGGVGTASLAPARRCVTTAATPPHAPGPSLPFSDGYAQTEQLRARFSAIRAARAAARPAARVSGTVAPV